MKIIFTLVVGFFLIFLNFVSYSQDDNVKVDGRYGPCYQKKGFDSFSENQPMDTWGFKNVEIYSEFIYFYDAAFLRQDNNFLILSKDCIQRIETNNIGNETYIYTSIVGKAGIYAIRLRSTSTHDRFIAKIIN